MYVGDEDSYRETEERISQVGNSKMPGASRSSNPRTSSNKLLDRE